MVNISTVLVIGGAAILFFALGGLGGLKSIGTGLGGKLSSFIPSLQSASASSASEQEAIEADQALDLAATSITQMRKFAGTLQTSVIRRGTTLIDKPPQEQLKTLSGVGTAQFSTGQIGILTEAKKQEIAERFLSPQDIADIAALEARREAAIERGIAPNIKLSGAELLLRKREQEELSKSLLTSQFGGQTFIGGKLFANPLFVTGGK